MAVVSSQSVQSVLSRALVVHSVLRHLVQLGHSERLELRAR
ncbi:putative uncharacterized protein [Corynebacterium casei UCMA 3821]|uniref:Uncharacterized protein n=1 Tax=Corynebacterium casei UCMA 3821 TaxID=1110505 RepID=G7HYA4_9CORY|nr:putative uncharacterized protein [Corynebacterium casei UCMA 3821]